MGKGAVNRLAEAGASIAIVDLNKEAGEQMVQELSTKHTNQKFIVRPPTPLRLPVPYSGSFSDTLNIL